MCQYIYNTHFLKHNKCPLSIAQLVYSEVVLGKCMDWMTINIQSKSNMKVPFHLFVGLGRKFPHGGLGKKMASKEVPNLLVVWSSTSSNNKKAGCTSIKRRLMEATIKGRMVENALNDMVDNDNTKKPYLLPAIEGGEYGYRKEGSGPTMDEGMPNMKADFDPFQKINGLEQELAASRALVEKYKAKVEQLEHDLKEEKNIVFTLCGEKH
jgi:hypothetical protein